MPCSALVQVVSSQGARCQCSTAASKSTATIKQAVLVPAPAALIRSPKQLLNRHRHSAFKQLVLNDNTPSAPRPPPASRLYTLCVLIYQNYSLYKRKPSLARSEEVYT